MPRYFFDIQDGAYRRDETGTECRDLDAVRREAKRALPEMVRDQLPGSGERHSLTMVVRDAEDRTVYTATLRFTGRIAGEPPAV